MKATLIAKNDISKDNSQWKLQTSLPEAEANLITSKTGNLVRGLIIATAIISFIIMVFTKLFPCIRTSLPQVFCDRWNEFWFSLSVSVFAAIVFYFIFHPYSSLGEKERSGATYSLRHLFYLDSSGHYVRGCHKSYHLFR